MQFTEYCLQERLTYWLKHMLRADCGELDARLRGDHRLGALCSDLGVRLWWLTSRRVCPQEPIGESVVYPEGAKVDLMFYWRLRATHPRVYDVVFRQAATPDPTANEFLLWRFNRVPKSTCPFPSPALAAYLIDRPPFEGLSPSKQVSALARSEMREVPPVRELAEEDRVALSFVVMNDEHPSLRHWFLQSTNYLQHLGEEDRAQIFGSDMASALLAMQAGAWRFSHEVKEIIFLNTVDNIADPALVFDTLGAAGIKEDYYHPIQLVLQKSLETLKEVGADHVFARNLDNIGEVITAAIHHFKVAKEMINCEEIAKLLIV